MKTVSGKVVGHSLARPPGIPVREFPGIADPKIPAGNSRKFLKFWRELRGIYRSFVFFPIFIVDSDILLFNLTHCNVLCARRTIGIRLPPFEQNLEWRLLTQLIVFIEYRYIFKYWYRYWKITEQHQNFANSDRYTNEDAEIILIGHRPMFCIHRPGMEGVLRGGSVRRRLSWRRGAFLDTTLIDRCRSVSTCGTDGKLLVTFG